MRHLNLLDVYHALHTVATKAMNLMLMYMTLYVYTLFVSDAGLTGFLILNALGLCVVIVGLIRVIVLSFINKVKQNGHCFCCRNAAVKSCCLQCLAAKKTCKLCYCLMKTEHRAGKDTWGYNQNIRSINQYIYIYFVLQVHYYGANGKTAFHGYIGPPISM